MNYKDQRINVRFCFELGKTVKETYDMLVKVYQDNAMSERNIYRWFGAFKKGMMSVDDKERSGRPSMVTDEIVQKINIAVLKDRRKSVRMIADEVGLPKSEVHRILTEILEKRKLSARIVPKILNDVQKMNRKDCCLDYLKSYEKNPSFLEKIVTGDETWVFAYEPETKRQSMEWRGKSSPAKKIARMSKSKIKCMLITFFDLRGLIHYEFVPKGQTVNQHFYKDVLTRLFEKLRNKRPEMWQSRDFRILHDNARPHVSLLVNDFLAEKRVSVMPHPPYSPDLSPCDFFLFGKLKSSLKGIIHKTEDEIKETAIRKLKTVTADDYEGCFRSLVKRWRQCIGCNGDYFEGDK